MRQIYTLILYCALPFLILRLVWRARRNPAYLRGLPERLGFFKVSAPARSIWIHTVSLGEAIAATPLIRALLERHPDWPVVVTTTTLTGSTYVLSQFKNRVIHGYLPFDFPYFNQRFLRKFQPKLGIIMETELWPNLLDQTKKHGLPMILANARLSERSAKGYARIASITRNMLLSFNWVAAQSLADGDRFVSLGLSADRVKVVGNLKFDCELPENLGEQVKTLKVALGHDRPIWVVASTHAGEDPIILEAFEKLLLEFPKLLLILVPRHPERFSEVADLCVTHGFKIARRSLGELPDINTSIYLGDTMGELMVLYGVSTLALVAGSIVPKGGHNLLEPASLGLPILSGHGLENFVEIRDLLLEAEALREVSNSTEIVKVVSELLQNLRASEAMGARALCVVEENRGALEKHLELINELVELPTH